MRSLALLVTAPAIVAIGFVSAVAIITAPAGSSAFASPAAAGSSCMVTGGGPAVGDTVSGVRLSAEQMRNAQIIVGVVKARRLPERAGQIALMTSMQESSLIVIHHGDAVGPDSRGLFQQRASWGPESVRLDPAKSTGLFFDRLVKVPGWETAPPQLAAHEVQRNGDAGDYVRWISFSQGLETALGGQDAKQVQCTGGTVPPGAPPSAKAKAALDAAKSMLGKPYCWAGGDAHGPTHGTGGPGCDAGVTGFDCSGLVLYAWAQAGLNLPHLAADQARIGRRVPLAQARPGDLVFLSNPADGLHHVAMVWSIAADRPTGAGQIIEAQDFNVPVHIRPWRGTAEPEAVPYAARLAG